MALLRAEAEIVEAPDSTEPGSADPEDDELPAGAVAAGLAVVVAGAEPLLDVAGWRGVRILRPRQRADELLPEP